MDGENELNQRIYVRPNARKDQRKIKNKNNDLNNESIFQKNEKLKQILAAQQSDHKQQLSKLRIELEKKEQRNVKQKQEFELKLKALEQKIERNRSKIEELQKDEIISTDADLERENIELEALIERKGNEKDETNKNLQQIILSTKELRKELDDLNHYIKSLPQASSIEMLRIEKRRIEQERDTKMKILKQQYDEISQTCDNLTNSLNDLTQQAEILENENERLYSQNEDFENEIQTLLSKKQSIQDKQKENNQKLDVKQVKNIIMERSKEANEEIKAFKKEQKKQLESAENQNDYLRKEIEDRNMLIEKLKYQIEDLNGKLNQKKMNSKGKKQQDQINIDMINQTRNYVNPHKKIIRNRRPLNQINA